jgi:alkylated DNA nucleotide flippase Atl1
MPKLSAEERIRQHPAAFVAVLEEEKAKRFKARTMLIPSPDIVRSEIEKIPSGQTRTMKELRQQLAKSWNADVTCPAAAMRCWRLIAAASNPEPMTPWWRVTRDGKPHVRLEGHRELLAAEGVSI